MYEYRATIISVYDGDTVTADIELGFGVCLKKQKLRLEGIDAPELRGDSKEAGLKAKKYLEKLILEKEVLIYTNKDRSGKYGRYLVRIETEGLIVNVAMVQSGHAVIRVYEEEELDDD